MGYEPTPGDLPGRKWVPSNSTDGGSFIANWCGRCQRDRSMREGIAVEDCADGESCEILAASFRGEAVEWRRLGSGGTMCIAFIPAGQGVPVPRCAATRDMFDQTE